MAHSSRSSSLPSLWDILRGGTSASGSPFAGVPGLPLPHRRCSKRASPSDKDSRSHDVSPHSCVTALPDDQECKRMRSQQDTAGARCLTRSSARPASRLVWARTRRESGLQRHPAPQRLQAQPVVAHAPVSHAIATSAASFPSATTACALKGLPAAPLLTCLSHDGHDGRLHAPTSGGCSTSSVASGSFATISRRSSCSSDCTAVLTPASITQDEDAEMTSPQHTAAQARQQDAWPAPGAQEAEEQQGEGLDEDGEEELDDVQCWLGQEARFTPQHVFERQASSSKLTPAMREMLVEWMCEVAINFRLQAETFILAVNYLDRYLSVMAVAKQQLQLLGAACLWVASKYEDVWPPSAQQMADMTENTYTAREVARMEAQVTHTLGWNLAVPCSSLKFLNAFVEKAQVTSRRVLALSECLVQLAALDGATFVQAPASRVAACALSVALAAFGQTAGIPHVVRAAQWRDNEQLAHMSKELYARFTRMLAPGAARNCIISQYLARQRVIAATPGPVTSTNLPAQTMLCSVQSAAAGPAAAAATVAHPAPQLVGPAGCVHMPKGSAVPPGGVAYGGAPAAATAQAQGGLPAVLGPDLLGALPIPSHTASEQAPFSSLLL